MLMGKKIKKRDGFFKLFHKYNSSDAYQRRQKELEENDIQLEKKDWWSMFLAAFLTLILPAILVLGILVLVTFLFFRVI